MSRKKSEHVCLNCQKIYKPWWSSFSKFCSLSCQGKYQTNLKIISWQKNLINPVNTFGLLRPWARAYLLSKAQNKCSICGWSQINPFTNKYPLEVDHIDGDHKNNLISNLRILCPNCHSLTSTYKNLNKGRGRATRNKTP